MAAAVVAVLETHGGIEQDALAREFATRFDLARGYGRGAIELLTALRRGADWRDAARGLFGGAGSFGNGGAMRAAPVGAWFHDDLDRVVAEARRSAEVTHAHAEGVAGAVAVATAAAIALRGKERQVTRMELLRGVLEHMPGGFTRSAIARALGVADGTDPFEAARVLGDGAKVTAHDTVPLCLWIAGGHLDSYTDAISATIPVAGDIDTCCAIVGGIVALRDPPPPSWIAAREPLT